MEEATVRTKKRAEASSNNLSQKPGQPPLDHSTIPLVSPSPCKRSCQPPVRFAEEELANPEAEAVNDDTITPKRGKVEVVPIRLVAVDHHLSTKNVSYHTRRRVQPSVACHHTHVIH